MRRGLGTDGWQLVRLMKQFGWNTCERKPIFSSLQEFSCCFFGRHFWTSGNIYPGFQSLDGSLTCMLSCLLAIPQIPICSDTCRPFGSRRHSRSYVVTWKPRKVSMTVSAEVFEIKQLRCEVGEAPDMNLNHIMALKVKALHTIPENYLWMTRSTLFDLTGLLGWFNHFDALALPVLHPGAAPLKLITGEHVTQTLHLI